MKLEQDDKIAKNLLAGKTCDNCWYIDIEFDGHKYCSQRIVHGKMGDVAKENTCTAWEEDPDAGNPVARLVRELREDGSRWLEHERVRRKK